MMAEPDRLNVLFLASEADPLIKVGGLGDVAGSLPLALRELDSPVWVGPRLDVRLVLPFHQAIRNKIGNLKLLTSFKVRQANSTIDACVYTTSIHQMPVYLIDGAPIAPDGLVYSRDPELDGLKYVFFSAAAIEMIKHIDWKPDIVHANDWHTGTALYSLKIRQNQESFYRSIHSLISVHNLPFMGKDAVKAIKEFGFPPSPEHLLPQWAEYFPLPLGLASADHIVAVSPGYSQEILTPEFGCGLQDYLQSRRGTLSGILNGLDQEAWDPATDTKISSRFDRENIKAKSRNKSVLQAELNLESNPDTPLLIMITRMDQQKGVDIAVDGLRLAVDHKWQAVILGTGDSMLETRCRSLEVEYPDRVRALIRYDSDLSRRIYAAGDILLMPSRYEPCGLTQMIAMRYGCVPLARATGGLRDTIRDDPTLATSTGFLFEQPLPDAFAETLRRALYSFTDQENWQEIQVRGMDEEFSWKNSGLKYAELYQHYSGSDL